MDVGSPSFSFLTPPGTPPPSYAETMLRDRQLMGDRPPAYDDVFVEIPLSDSERMSDLESTTVLAEEDNSFRSEGSGSVELNRWSVCSLVSGIVLVIVLVCLVITFVVSRVNRR